MKKHTVIDETGGVVWVEFKAGKKLDDRYKVKGKWKGLEGEKRGERKEIASKRVVG